MSDPSQTQQAPTAKRSRFRRLSRWFIGLLACYLGINLLMLALENRLVYHPAAASDWDAAPDPAIRDVEFASGDGTHIHAWWLPHAGSADAVVYCHGNAGNLSHRGQAICDWGRELNASVLIFDYPGYGKSGGTPTEAGCYAAADAAYDWLVQQQVGPARILLFGKSLGGGVALELASRRPHRALVLARTFTSLPDTAQQHYPWLPVKLLMRNQFNNLDRIATHAGPVFIAHGTADELIPFAHGERLFEAAPGPKEFLRQPGLGHNSPLGPEFFTALRRFLAASD